MEAIEPEHRFAFSWVPGIPDPAAEETNEPRTLVEFRLRPSEAGTVLDVRESGFARLPEARRASLCATTRKAGRFSSTTSGRMSPADRLSSLPARAGVFAALGDPTRLGLVAALAKGAPPIDSALSAGTALTRQGVTKHLRVLEKAGVVHRQRAGRETLFGLDRAVLVDVEADPAAVVRQWGDALARLRSFATE